MTHLDDIISKLSPDTQKKYKLANELNKDYIPTASVGLNILLGGGVGIGKQATFWGNESSGKSAFWLQTIGINQKLGRACVYMDAEKTFDKEWAERLGVNTSELFVPRPSSIAEFTDMSRDFIRAGVELIVLDSSSSLMPGSFFDEGEMKLFEDTGQIGQFAREFGQSCRMIQGENYSCAMVHISQIRVDLKNKFMPGSKPSGGKETEHMDSLRIRMFSSMGEKQTIMGKLQIGDILMEEHIGRKVTWSVDKNKLNGHYGTGQYDLYFRGDAVGVDRYGELLDYGIKYGAVNKGGAWYKIYGHSAQGRDGAVKYISEHPEVADKIEVEIREQSVR